jgi:pyruvate dehydrogenase E2 component (dihydrolipoamide acetyltransferase)
VRDDLQDYLEKQRTAAPTAEIQPPAQPAPVGVAAEDVEIIPLTNMQKTIVRRLTEAKQTVPHIYISNEIDMTDALALRQQFNASAGEGGVKVSVNDLIIKACALALEKFPEVNSSYKDNQFLRHKHINIGMAVDVPNGLVVPVIHDANIKGVRSIARETKALAEKARNNKLTVNDMSGGTFSISNLGMMDITEFKAIINPPEAGILAIGATRKVFVPVDGQPVVRDIMNTTISADHRVLGGAACARFLQEVKRLLQNPYSLLG